MGENPGLVRAGRGLGGAAARWLGFGCAAGGGWPGWVRAARDAVAQWEVDPANLPGRWALTLWVASCCLEHDGLYSAAA